MAFRYTQKRFKVLLDQRLKLLLELDRTIDKLLGSALGDPEQLHIAHRLPLVHVWCVVTDRP